MPRLDLASGMRRNFEGHVYWPFVERVADLHAGGPLNLERIP